MLENFRLKSPCIVWWCSDVREVEPLISSGVSFVTVFNKGGFISCWLCQVVGSQGQMMPMVPSGLSSVPRLTVMPPSSASSGASAPTPVALVPNIAAGNNSITIQVKVLNF